MITYQLNKEGDLFLRNGTIAIVSDSDETAQDIKTKLRTFQGEVFYNVVFGVPYFQVIFKKPFDKDLADSIIIQTIYSSINVSNIINFQSRVDTFSRRYFVNFIASYKNNEAEQNITISQEFSL